MAGGGSVLIYVSSSNPLLLVAGLGMLAATILGGVLLFVSQRTGGARRFALQRRRFLDHLDAVRTTLQEAGRQQRAAAAHRHPDPAALSGVVADPTRIWERRPGDADFAVVRAGLGPDRLWRPVHPGASPDPLLELDPVTTAAARALLHRHRALGNLPVEVPITGVVSVVGPAAETRAVLRAMTAQLVALHAPDDLRLAWCVGRSAVPEFEWVKWLPHSLDPEAYDGPAPRRLAGRDAAELAAVLRPELDRRVAATAAARRYGAPVAYRGPRLSSSWTRPRPGRRRARRPARASRPARPALAQRVPRRARHRPRH